MAKKEKKGGCLSKIIKVILIFAIIAIIFPMIQSNSKPSSSSATEKPTATAKTTTIPTATNTQEPTATPIPDLSTMSIDDAIKAAAELSIDNATIVKETKFNDGMAEAYIHIDSSYGAKSIGMHSAIYTVNFTQWVMQHPSVNIAYVQVDTQMTDKYGNSSDTMVYQATIKRETAEKFNYDVVRTWALQQNSRALKAFDLYWVHPSIKDEAIY